MFLKIKKKLLRLKQWYYASYTVEISNRFYHLKVTTTPRFALEVIERSRLLTAALSGRYPKRHLRVIEGGKDGQE